MNHRSKRKRYIVLLAINIMSMAIIASSTVMSMRGFSGPLGLAVQGVCLFGWWDLDDWSYGESGLTFGWIGIETDFQYFRVGSLTYLQVPLWPVVVINAIATLWLAFNWPARRTRECIECGYSLIGNTSGACPECGYVISDLASQKSNSSFRIDSMCYVACVIVAVPHLVILLPYYDTVPIIPSVIAPIAAGVLLVINNASNALLRGLLVGSAGMSIGGVVTAVLTDDLPMYGRDLVWPTVKLAYTSLLCGGCAYAFGMYRRRSPDEF